jgi:hypothetical protein
MKAVAACNKITLELTAVIADDRMLVVKSGHGDAGDVEADVASSVEAGGDEILDHLLLTVDGDCLSAGKVGQGDAVTMAVELKVDTAMYQPVAVHPVAEADLVEQVDGRLFENTGAHPRLDVGTVAQLENDRCDATPGEHVGQ